MARSLKEQILNLKNEGYPTKDIQSKLGCSLSTISYHIYPKTKESTKLRNAKNKKHGDARNKTTRQVVYNKMGNFNSQGHGIDKKYSATTFSVKDLLNHLGENPKCYLTGEAIDLSKGETYSFDHIIPLSRGGLNTLSNLGLCLREINCAKADRTVDEFLQLCSLVLDYNKKL